MLQLNKIIFIISTVVLLIVILVFLIVRLGRSKHGGNAGRGSGNAGSGMLEKMIIQLKLLKIAK